MGWKTKSTAMLLGVWLALAVSSVAAAGAAEGSVHVEPVDAGHVKRLITLAITAPDVDSAMTSPATCVRDGSGVWLLPAFVAPGASEVSCKVEHGSSLVLNMGGALCTVDDTTTRAQLPNACKKQYADTRGVQTAIVDGTEVDEFAPAPTGTFDIKFEDGNVLGVPAGKTASYYLGRNIMISGLSKGAHSIRFIYRNDPALGDAFDVDTTYTVTVR